MKQQRRRLRKSKCTHLKANLTPLRSTLIHGRTGSNGMNLGHQTKPQKPDYKRLSHGPIRRGHVAEPLVVRQVPLVVRQAPLVVRQVVMGQVTSSFLSPKQLYRYKKTPIHWYYSSTITGISWSTPKTSILLHT